MFSGSFGKWEFSTHRYPFTKQPLNLSYSRSLFCIQTSYGKHVNNSKHFGKSKQDETNI
jgi:hypothetical protein